MVSNERAGANIEQQEKIPKFIGKKTQLILIMD